jgi:ABC-2 type transport system permease protein
VSPADRIEGAEAARGAGEDRLAGPVLAFVLAAGTLAAREWVRFLRQRSRLIGAFAQPVLFWVLFGAGLRGSFRAPEWAPAGTSFQEYFLPGTAVMILLFTAIFSTISLIEDRREGFLQGVLVAPVPRAALVLGKLAGATGLAVVQAAAFLVLGLVLSGIGLLPTMDWVPSWPQIPGLLAFGTVLGLALAGLGYVIAWQTDSTQGFHAVMSVFLFPMWLLSGAFFPASGSGWLQALMRINPLTYGTAGLRRLMYAGRDLPVAPDLPSLGACLAVTCLFCAACAGLAVWCTGRPTVRNVR